MSNVYYGVEPYTGKILKHYGIEGQKWGKRRWQYPDGRFNEEGKERYFGSKSNDTNLVKTKTETTIEAGTPKFLKISRKVIKENPDKFTNKKQKEFDNAMSIWTDSDFFNKYGFVKPYTDLFKKYFEGNSKMSRVLEKGKYCLKFEKDLRDYYKTKKDYDKNYISKYKDNIKKAKSIGALLDLGIKPNKENIKKMTYYLSTY